MKSLHKAKMAYVSLQDAICMPDPKYISDPEQFVIQYSRNVMSFIILVIGGLTSPFFRLMFGLPFVNALYFAHVVFFSTFFILCCRRHVLLFRCICFLSVLLAGPILIVSNPEAIIIVVFQVISYPTLVYHMTGNFYMYTGAALAQLILLWVYYHQQLQDVIKNTDYERLTNNIESVIFYTTTATSIVLYWNDKLLKSNISKIKELRNFEAAIKRQKDFLLTMSHEIRNPLNSLIGSIQAASFDLLPRTTAELLKTAELCGELLAHLLNNLLDSGKIEVGDLDILPVTNNILNVIERIWLVSACILTKVGVKGSLRVTKQLPFNLLVDSYRLKQVVVNVVQNAAKFTPRGGFVTVTIDWISNNWNVLDKHFEPLPFQELTCVDDKDEGLEQKNESFKVIEKVLLNTDARKLPSHLFTSPDCVCGILKISIRDTGIGIKSDESKQIFQQFKRAAESTIRASGLGLYISKEILKKMSGDIRVYSKLGQGSCFTLCMPCECSADQSALMQSSTAPLVTDSINTREMRTRKPMRVLIVDDDVFNTKIIEIFCQKIGIMVENIEFASSGVEAVSKYKEAINNHKGYDLITMDLEMPHMDGKTACREIRKLEHIYKLHRCSIIIVSGNVAESEMRECLDQNKDIRAQAFYKKPIKYEELKSFISPDQVIC